MHAIRLYANVDGGAAMHLRDVVRRDVGEEIILIIIAVRVNLKHFATVYCGACANVFQGKGHGGAATATSTAAESHRMRAIKARR